MPWARSSRSTTRGTSPPVGGGGGGIGAPGGTGSAATTNWYARASAGSVSARSRSGVDATPARPR